MENSKCITQINQCKVKCFLFSGQLLGKIQLSIQKIKIKKMHTAEHTKARTVLGEFEIGREMVSNCN